MRVLLLLSTSDYDYYLLLLSIGLLSVSLSSDYPLLSHAVDDVVLL